jgi:Fe2+ or Zn2+ uptake regulation protein
MKQWEEKFKQSGRRMTQTRKLLLTLFDTTHKPITIEEIGERLHKKGWNGNMTTIYRQIQTLLREDFLETSDIPGRKRRYEKKKEHHHHFVCLRCKKTQCLEKKVLEKDIQSIIQKAKRRGMDVRQHSFSLSGLCKKCNNK